MRSLIIIVLIFIAQFSDAQVLNDSNATIILSKTKQDINLKIWNAVSAGRIIAYRNDSFTSTVPKDSLNSWYKVYKRREITDPDEGVFNRLGTVVFEPHDFNPNKDFTGLDFVFEPSWDVESTTYSNKLVGVAPTWKITTESGIELGNHLLFIVKLKDLEDVFSTRKLKALAMQRSTLGDFKFRYLDEYSSSEDIANSMLWNSLLGQKNILTWNLKFDSILGIYNTRLINEAAQLAHEKGSIFFKNEKLTDPYEDIETELSQDIEVPVPDPDNPDDPYALIGVKVNIAFSFEYGYNHEFLALKSGKVIKMYYRYNEEPIGIYFSYSSIKDFLKPHNQIVLETLMEGVAK